MPISPIPPSARNTSSSPGEGPEAVGDCSVTLSSLARPPDRDLPVGQPAFPATAIQHDERAVLSKIEELAADFFPAGIDGQRLSGRAATLAPRRADCGKTDTPIPDGKPAFHGAGKMAQHRLRLQRHAVRGKMR